ncbi:hypothetical protein EGW08_006520 [Elysia chlorotica]|uniref:Uncharacterized protein n=1 Tax=Elysia chlorotica TaxID=188477 RepID=A0A433TVY1_ELYCH|nr:hypothetical protein EGW08_006520 [Elysia chlorotica]
MARRDSIALYTSSKGVQWRRFSEPFTSKTVGDDKVFAKYDAETPTAFRRYSFSALEDYRKGKLPVKYHQDSVAFSSSGNLTPSAIRGQVDQILESNGFTETERAKVSHLRRCSENIDQNVVNLLGDGVRRSSFGAGASSGTYSVDYQTVKNNKNETEKKGNTRRTGHTVMHDSVYNDQDRLVRTNAWENFKYPPSSARSLIKDNQRKKQDDDGNERKSSETKNIDEHLKLKRSLWNGKCRRDSLSKFRNRIVDDLRAHVETDTEYWRRCRSVNHDGETPKAPKCKYRLRENGLIASDLAYLTKIDIDTTANKLDSYGLYDSSKDHLRSTPECTTSNKAEILRNLLKRRRKSSLFSEYDFDRKSLIQRSLSSFSDRNSRSDSPDFSPSQPLFYQRSISRQVSKTKDGLDSEAYLAYLRANLRKSSCEKRRWSQTPSEGFELIGSEALHGSPGYKGRLMLLTARTVRFNDEFISGT